MKFVRDQSTKGLASFASRCSDTAAVAARQDLRAVVDERADVAVGEQDIAASAAAAGVQAVATFAALALSSPVFVMFVA